MLMMSDWRMLRISHYAVYGGFNGEYVHRSISSVYEFNGLQSFIDVLNKEFFNSSKVSEKSHYILVDEIRRKSWRWGKFQRGLV